VDDPYQGAAVYEKGGHVVEIIEKPPRGTSTTNWNSAGLYALGTAIFEHLANLQPSARGEYELTTAIQALITSGAEVRIHSVEGDWRDVGRPSDIAVAEQMLKD
jgi:dTDP-glucose pyrophosphorylase